MGPKEEGGCELYLNLPCPQLFCSIHPTTKSLFSADLVLSRCLRSVFVYVYVLKGVPVEERERQAVG